VDYSAPVGTDMRTRMIGRHRLEKKDPNAAVSDPVKPIIYYVDRGTPEPVLSALREGASWWNQAFEAAGFRNAFQVQVMPEGASPMDVRYNTITWVHRSTRGWSTGASMICTTGSRGNCTVTLSAIPRTTLSVTFSVTNVARSGWVYLPSANHDPEADSDGTSITVSRPW